MNGDTTSNDITEEIELDIPCANANSCSEEESEELQLHYEAGLKPDTVHQKKILCLKIIFSLILIMCCLLFLLVIAEFVIIMTTKNSENTPDIDNYVVKTTEFQIKLTSFKNEESREAAMSSWMSYFDRNSKYFSLDDESIVITANTRKQYYLDSKGSKKCGPNYQIRVRDYVEGEAEGTCTIDIKDNSHLESTAREMPFWPSPQYAATSSQKCERDEHQCDHKYSRETRILLNEWKEWSTCQDLVDMFPWAYNDLTSKQLNYKVSPGDEEYWFVQEYSGYLNGDTRYKAAFTMKYPSLDDARNDHSVENATKGEWSIRLYSLNDGLSSEYNSKVYDDVENAWKKLMDYYGNDDC